jgi:UvrB/uvrC motif
MQVTTFVQGLTPTLPSRGTFAGNCCAARGPLPLGKSPSVSRRGLNLVCCTAAWKTLDVDAELDKSLFELETKLVQAVEAEAYDRATTLRDEIAQLQSPAFVEVLQAHMRFYKAFDSVCVL